MCLGIGVWLTNCVASLGRIGQGNKAPPSASAEDPIAYAVGYLLIPVGMAVTAIALGYRARSQRQGGLGMAKAGVILGVAYLGVLVCVVVGMFIIARW
jgi:hypothetical protein